jgi:hypothetical protein
MSKTTKDEWYVDNERFSTESEAFSALCRPIKKHWLQNIPEDHKAKDWSKFRPKIPDYLGECFLLISTKLAYRPNFSAYSWKEEMISDGVENCLHYCDNFDTTKGKAFGYFTQICWYAFLRRIEKEKTITSMFKDVIQQGDRANSSYMTLSEHDKDDVRFIKDTWDFTSPTDIGISTDPSSDND